MSNRASYEELGNQFEDSYEKLNRQLEGNATLCTAITFALQLITAAHHVIYGEYSSWRQLIEYIVFYMIASAAVIFTLHAILSFIDKRIGVLKEVNYEAYCRVRQITSLARLAVVVWAAPIINFQVTAIYVAPLAVVLASVVYADLIVFKFASASTVIVSISGYIINGLLRADSMPDNYLLNCICALGCIVGGCVIGKQLLLVETGKEKEQLIAKERAREDGLTGLWNRKKINEIISDDTTMMTIAMIDIDDFKKINDTYGHPFGDIVLKRLASVLKEVESTTIKVGRYGGEEFTVMFVGQHSEEKVNRVLNTIRKTFHSQSYSEHVDVKNTISVGFASRMVFPHLYGEALLEEADKALYKAKHTGKNRVVKADREDTTC